LAEKSHAWTDTGKLQVIGIMVAALLALLLCGTENVRELIFVAQCA
jgi:hypothetical protein